MVDTVRTLAQLRAATFADGQGAGAITPQDMRDFVVSLGSLSGIVNVKDFPYLAVGDGVTDDTAAVQAWLTYLAANGGIGIWSGEFKINSQISITSNAKPFRLIGAGRGAAKVVVGADIGTPLSFNSCSEVIVEGFSLDCQFSSFPANANHGIVFKDCDDSLLRDVYIEDYKNAAVLAYGTVANTHSNVILDNVHFDGLLAANNGLLIADMNDSGLRNCGAVGADGSPGYGLQLKNDSRRCFIENSSAKNCTAGLAFGQDGGIGTSYSRVSNITLVGNQAGFVGGGAIKNKVSGLLIDMESAGNDAMNFEDGFNYNSIECVIRNVANAKHAVRFRDAAIKNNVHISHYDNNNASGNVAHFAVNADDNRVFVARTSNMTFSDPFDLITDNAGGTNIFEMGERPIYEKLVIATGAITTSSHKEGVIIVDTEAAAAADDLDTLSGAAVEGAVRTLCSLANTKDTTVKHNTGNIMLNGAADFTLSNTADTLTLRYNARISKWCETGRGDNA